MQHKDRAGGGQARGCDAPSCAVVGGRRRLRRRRRARPPALRNGAYSFRSETMSIAERHFTSLLSMRTWRRGGNFRCRQNSVRCAVLIHGRAPNPVRFAARPLPWVAHMVVQCRPAGCRRLGGLGLHQPAVVQGGGGGSEPARAPVVVAAEERRRAGPQRSALPSGVARPGRTARGGVGGGRDRAGRLPARALDQDGQTQEREGAGVAAIRLEAAGGSGGGSR